MADAALEGAQAYNVRQQGIEERELTQRKTAAYNALSSVYGPLAGDPTSAIQMQEYGQREQTNPIAVQQAQANLTGTGLENTGREQTNAFNAEMNPLKLQSAVEQNREQPLAFNTEQAQKLAQTGLTRAQTGLTGTETQAQQFGLQQQKAAATRQAAFGILTALSDTAQNGGDVGAEFDKYAPAIAQMEGVDQAHIAPLRQMLTQDPTGTINKLQTALMSQGMVGGVGGKGGAAKGAVLSPVQQRAQQVNALQTIQERTQAVPAATDQAAGLIPKMSSIAMVRKANENIPGTPEYQFKQLAAQIGSNLSLDDLRAVRTSGLSLGRTNIAEFQASAHAFANMDLGQDPAILQANLRRLNATYKQINDNMTSDIKRMSMGVPGLNLTGPTGGNPQQQQQGQQPQASPQDIVNELRRRGVVK